MSDSPLSTLPWWVLPGIAGLVLVIFAGALAASCFIDDNTLRTQMFTGAYGLATGAVGYYFGSSAGSAKKDDTIQASRPQAATTTMTGVTADTVVAGTEPSGAAIPPAEKKD